MKTPSDQLPKLAQAIQLARDTADQPNPPERLVYWSDRHNVGAVMDPFSPQRCGVVACLGEVVAQNETAHLADAPHSRRQMLGLVVHAVGRKMLQAARVFGEDQFVIERGGEQLEVSTDKAGEERVLERVVGFAQPRIGHVVMGLGVRYEIQHTPADTATLNQYWGRVRLNGSETSELDTRLDAQALIGPILDNPQAADSLALMERMAAILG